MPNTLGGHVDGHQLCRSIDGATAIQAIHDTLRSSRELLLRTVRQL